MKLVTYPKSSPLVIVTSLVIAFIVAAFIAQLVFKFAYFASGLAADNEEERRRAVAPIEVEFQADDPNNN